MKCTIVKPAQNGSIKAIPSKSMAHRWLIAAALSGIDIEKILIGISQDIDATRDCLKAICEYEEASAKGASTSEDSGEALRLEPRESGSTLRFLVPIAAALGIKSDFHCEGRLAERPMYIMRVLLGEHGCEMSPEGSNPIRISGKLESGIYSLPGNVSSQYVSGLLFALPLLDGDSEIRIEGELQSRPYVNLTLRVLERSGIEIEEISSDSYSYSGSANINSNSDESEATQGTSLCFKVRGNQKYSLTHLPEVEGDWSNAAFWLVLDAINKMQGRVSSSDNPLAENIENTENETEEYVLDSVGIEVTGLKRHSSQGDRAIASIIEQAMTDEPLTVDASDIPDLVPVVSILASARRAGTKTFVVNAERLRYKESDRLTAVNDMLRSLGGNIEELQDGLIIEGVWRLRGGTIDSHNDHRIAMAAAVAAACSDEPITIERAEVVRKSYPNFFEDYEKLGGIVERI